MSRGLQKVVVASAGRMHEQPAVREREEGEGYRGGERDGGVGASSGKVVERQTGFGLGSGWRIAIANMDIR